MIRRSVAIPFAACAIFCLTLAVRAANTANPFVGDWALTLPDGHPGWLGVTDDNGKLSASLLWNVGSVLPVEKVRRDGDALILTRGTGRDALSHARRPGPARCRFDGSHDAGELCRRFDQARGQEVDMRAQPGLLDQRACSKQIARRVGREVLGRRHESACRAPGGRGLEARQEALRCACYPRGARGV